MTVYATVGSPVGELLLCGDEPAAAGGSTALTSLSMPGQRGAVRVRPHWRHAPDAFTDALRQLGEYFAGERTSFDLDLAASGTDFQEQVWRAVDSIPYGTTVSYGEVADQVGVDRSQTRAVGAAIGANPLLLLRPCHRVVAADGGMRGYAAGVARKEFLLTHEGALRPGLW